jgi:colanic acid biosynthesis glycosyl transferase WcaI
VRIAYVTQMYPPDRLGHAARVHDMVVELAAQGDDVTVVAPPPTFPWGVHPRQRRRRVESVDAGVRAVRLWSWQPDRPDPSFTGRLAYYLVFAVHAWFWMAWNARRFDVVVSSTPPVFTLLPGRLARALGRRRVAVADVHDLWVDAAVSLGFITERSLSTRLSRWLETSSCRKADVVAVTTHHMGESLVARGIDAARVCWVPNGVDVARFVVAAQAAKKPQFVFTGNVGHAADLGLVVQALALVRRTHPEATLALTGDGDIRPALEEQARGAGLQDAVRFHGVVSHEERARIVAESVAGFALLRRLPSLDYLVPTKAYEYLASGIPFIGAKGREVAALAQASGGGLLTENDPEAIAETMRWVLDHPADAASMGRRGKAHVESTYDRAAVARRLRHAIQAAAEARRA